MHRIILLIVLLGIYTPAFAQDDLKAKKPSEMNVDLPDETEETDLVEKGQVQLETQLLYNKFADGEHALVGQGLLRYGLTKRLEVRLLIEEGYNRDRYMEETVQSTYPFAASAKFQVLKDHEWLPDITLVSYLKLPVTSKKAEQAIYWSPIFLAAFQHKIGEKWKLEYNGGIQQEAYSRDWVWPVSGSLHYKVVEPLELFTEYYAQFAAGQEPQHNLGLGAAYQVGEYLEFYAVYGGSVFYSEPNQFISGGLAYRLPR